MNTEQKIIQNIRLLSTAKQQQLLDFAEFLQKKDSLPKLKSIKGLCPNLDTELEFEEFKQVRKEVWNTFNKDI